MSKKIQYSILMKEDLLRRGWSEVGIEKLLPKELPLGGWYSDTVKSAEQSNRFNAMCNSEALQKLSIENEKNNKLEYMCQNISISNPANDYPLARALNRHFFIHIGETNTGKTYSALQALKTAQKGIYLSPLRLLAMEVQDTLLEAGCCCSLLTGEEEKIIPNSTVTSSTVEKLNVNNRYDVGVIDECQMLGDPARGGAWTRAILGLAAETIYLCMSKNALNICIQLIKLCGDTYTICECQRKTQLIMCNEKVGIKDLCRGDAIILFSRRDVLNYAASLEHLGIRVSVIYGALPYEARKFQVELYKTGQTDVIVSTDAIGMGLNLPVKRIIFAADRKYDGTNTRSLTSQEVKQIAGRAGRYGIYEEGFVSVFEESDANIKKIREKLYAEDVDLDMVILPFPEEYIPDGMRVSEAMELWQHVQYPTIFKHENLEVQLNKVKLIERKFPNMNVETILSLSKVTFDENNAHLMENYQLYISKYCKDEVIYSPFNMMHSDLTLLEQNYKEMQLYYSFHKNMGLALDINVLEHEKNDLVRRINEQLSAKKIKNEHRCRCCRNPLPPFYRFGICETCYGCGEWF